MGNSCFFNFFYVYVCEGLILHMDRPRGLWGWFGNNPALLVHLTHWYRVSQSNLELIDRSAFASQLAWGIRSLLQRLEIQVGHCAHLAFSMWVSRFPKSSPHPSVLTTESSSQSTTIVSKAGGERCHGRRLLLEKLQKWWQKGPEGTCVEYVY